MNIQKLSGIFALSICAQIMISVSPALAIPCEVDDGIEGQTLFCECKKDPSNAYCSCLTDPNQQICDDYCVDHPLEPFCDTGGTPTPLPTTTATSSSGTATPTPQATETPTGLPTIDASKTPTIVPTSTVTSAPTTTSTAQATATPTANATQTATPQATQTAQATATAIATPTATSKGEDSFGDGDGTDDIFVPTGCTPLEVYPHLYALNSSVSGYYGRIVTNRIHSVRSVLLRKASVEGRKSIRRDFQQNESDFNQLLSNAKKALASIDPVLVMCPDPVPSRCKATHNAIPSFRSSVTELSKVVSRSFKKATSKASQRDALKSLFSKSFTTAQTPKISERAMKSLVKYSQDKIPEASWICTEK